MLDLILQMLRIDDYYGVSQNIDVAKGVNKTPLTLKEGFKQLKRRKQWQQP